MVKSLTSPQGEKSRVRRWPLRRVIALVLIVSGVLWLAAGLAIRFLFF
jgi:hypothetical protein